MPSKTGFRLPRCARLRRRAEYRRVYESGVRAPGRFIVLFALPRPGGEQEGRLGITASRKVGGAVVRARCRRRIREVYRLHPEVLANIAVDVVVNARRGCAEAPWNLLVQDYIGCVMKARRRLVGQ